MTKRQLEDRLALLCEQRRQALNLLWECRLHLASGFMGRNLAVRIEALFDEQVVPKPLAAHVAGGAGHD